MSFNSSFFMKIKVAMIIFHEGLPFLVRHQVSSESESKRFGKTNLKMNFVI